MMAYVYTAEECGLERYPDGIMRLEGADETRDPAAANVFVVPPTLRELGLERVQALPYLSQYADKHVLWNVAEDITIHYPCGPLYLRCEAVRALVDACPTVRGWPWPVDDLWAPFEGFDLDVVFQGWTSTPLTGVVLDSVEKTDLRYHLMRHNFFYGYHYSDPAYRHLRESFIDTLRRSRLSLVPRSIPAGVVRYRFYEAMSAGRVPVHFCDGRELPWKDKIDYNRCTIHIAEVNAPYAGKIIKDWLSRHTDKQILEMGEYGRAMWLRYLDPRKWSSLFTEAVSEWIK